MRTRGTRGVVYTVRRRLSYYYIMRARETENNPIKKECRRQRTIINNIIIPTAYCDVIYFATPPRLTHDRLIMTGRAAETRTTYTYV